MLKNILPPLLVGLAGSASAPPMSLTFLCAPAKCHCWHLHLWVGSLVPELQNATLSMNAAGASAGELTPARSSSRTMTGGVGVSIPQLPHPLDEATLRSALYLGFQSFPYGNKLQMLTVVLGLITHFLLAARSSPLLCTISPSPSRVVHTTSPHQHTHTDLKK